MPTPGSACQDRSSEHTAAERKRVGMAVVVVVAVAIAVAVVGVVGHVGDSLVAAVVEADVLVRERLEVPGAARMMMAMKQWVLVC
jgi:ABC-type Fe3+-siderophore transport system permease subunit